MSFSLVLKKNVSIIFVALIPLVMVAFRTRAGNSGEFHMGVLEDKGQQET